MRKMLTTMETPLEITFRNTDRSEALEADIREHVSKLEEFYDRITSCKVVVEKPHEHHHKGNLYHVRIYIAIPQHDIVVDRDPGDIHAHEDPYVAVHDAFKAARRQLQDVVRKMRGDTKAHEGNPGGTVTKLFAESGYGFIETSDGREIYFHANSVLNDGFDDLQIGASVTFVEEEGNEGPQAAAVRKL